MHPAARTDRPPGRTSQRRVAVLDIDPDLGAGLASGDRGRATARVSAALHRLRPGPWQPGPEHLRGLALVASGLLARETVLAGMPASELLGPGDVLSLRHTGGDLLGVTRSWSVLVPSRILILDDVFAAGAAPWPAIADAVRDRLEAQVERASIHGAIRQLRRVEDRLAAMFAELAARWGRVGADGLVVALPLTHEELGRLIGAERPTVSLALTQLKADGILDRREDGAWVLSRRQLRM